MKCYNFGLYKVGIIYLSLATVTMSETTGSFNPPLEAEASAASVTSQLKQGEFRPEDIEILAAEMSRLDKKTFNHTPDVVNGHGYPIETHKVVTKSGYVLVLHRIPGPKSHNISSSSASVSAQTESWSLAMPIIVDDNKRGPPVILNHGLWQSSLYYVALNENSLAFLLADEGYDVWLANSRGNCYSDEHISMKKSDSNYWNFDLDDTGGEDLHTNIDYVLKTTGYETLQYIGYSNGNQVFLAGSSLHPEYNNKVKLMIALSPMAFMSNTKSTVLSWSHLTTTTYFYEMIQKTFGYSPVPDPKLSEFVKQYNDVFCSQTTADTKGKGSSCTSGLFGMSLKFNRNSTALDSKKEKRFDACPTSSKTIIQMSQLINSNQFERYDYRIKNSEVYGQLTPPLYKLWKINVPIALIWSKNDLYNDPSDVEKLARNLPKLVESYRVPAEGFSHTDFLFGQNAKDLVYKKVLQLLKKYN